MWHESETGCGASRLHSHAAHGNEITESGVTTSVLNLFLLPHRFFFCSLQILKGVAYFVRFLPVAFGIAIFQELAVAAVKTAGSSRVFDRTPVLFRSAGDLTDVGDQSVEVSTVHTVQLFNGVEIAEGMAVDDNVAAAFDLGDLIDGETDGLEQGDEGIQEQGGNQAGPDKGNGQDILDFRLFQIAGNPGGKELVLLSDLLVKAYFFALDLVREFRRGVPGTVYTSYASQA